MRTSAIAAAVLMSCLAPGIWAEAGKAVGTPGSPITIEVYSDFQCPVCKTLHDQILPLVLREYVATGKAYLIYREFPLTMHSHSREAANYATAAARVGKYQEVADALFRDQSGWGYSGKVWDTVASALSPAEQKRVQTLVKDPAVVAEVQRDMEAGTMAHVNQTPTMMVKGNGKTYPIGGMLPNYGILKSFLDGLVKK